MIYLSVKKDFSTFFYIETGLNQFFEKIRICLEGFPFMNNRSMVVPVEIELNNFSLAEKRIETLNDLSNDILNQKVETNADEKVNEDNISLAQNEPKVLNEPSNEITNQQIETDKDEMINEDNISLAENEIKVLNEPSIDI